MNCPIQHGPGLACAREAHHPGLCSPRPVLQAAPVAWAYDSDGPTVPGLLTWNSDKRPTVAALDFDDVTGRAEVFGQPEGGAE